MKGISSKSYCPACGGQTKKGDEITKKVMDEPDLLK